MALLKDPERSARLGHRLKRRVYRTRGSNDIIHLDGNDKLLPYGFGIHGCMDGWSRKLLWLEISASNKNPSIVGNYFIEYLEEIKGAPRIVRFDRGTENSLVRDIQLHLRQTNGNTSSLHCVQYGKSVHNQKIERFWNYFRECYSQHWIDYFKRLLDVGLFDSSSIFQKYLLQFCFSRILINEVKQIKQAWNLHRVRKMKGIESPTGMPEFIYQCPEYYGGQNCMYPIDIRVLNRFDADCSKSPLFLCPDLFAELCCRIMTSKGLSLPKNENDALELYATLLCELRYHYGLV